jgi:hypothetical protein
LSSLAGQATLVKNPHHERKLKNRFKIYWNEIISWLFIRRLKLKAAFFAVGKFPIGRA